MFNKWGGVSAVALVGAIPGAAAVAHVSPNHRSASDVTGLVLLLLSASCSVVGARRGSRWWLMVGGIAALWGLLVLLQMIVGE
jgi:hypothetical protein